MTKHTRILPPGVETRFLVFTRKSEAGPAVAQKFAHATLVIIATGEDVAELSASVFEIYLEIEKSADRS